MALEWVDCDFCGGSRTTPVFAIRDLKLGLPGEFHLVRCDGCGLLYINPRPTWGALQEYYPEYYPSFIQFNSSKNPWDGVVRRCRIVSSYQNGRRLLDVGCGTGAFLKEMSRFGEWELYGVEPLSVPAQIAREQGNIKIFQGTLLESDFSSEFFDVVTWWDVLEHVPNPRACLRETFRILKPGGWLFVQTPDPGSWEARLFGPHWIGWDTPRHLYLFSRPVLIRQLEKTGFRIIRVGSFAGNISTVCKSLGHCLSSRYSKMVGTLLFRAGDSSIIRVVTAPLYILLRRFDLTFAVLYIAQKPYH
ncbi:MAG: class I SAM-dependent methyltransferase [Anaerolineae bacterium]